MKLNFLFLVLFLCLSTVKVFFVLMNKVCKNEKKKKKSTGRPSVVVCLHSRTLIALLFFPDLLIVSAEDKFSK